MALIQPQVPRATPRAARSDKEATMPAILLWLLGVPLPIIIILLLLWH